MPAQSFWSKVLADKLVLICGGILVGILLVSFLPVDSRYLPPDGVYLLSILGFINLVAHRHPFVSFRWLYGFDLAIGVLLMLAALPDFNESPLAGVLVLALIPFNIWMGKVFYDEFRRHAALKGKFAPKTKDALSLEFTKDGTLLLGNGTAYRFMPCRKRLLLFSESMLATTWEIVRCDPDALVLKNESGTLHEYGRGN